MEEKLNKLFILCGASGVGKSTILNALVREKICKPVVKYSDRESFDEIDDITPVANIYDKELSCDIVYSMYGNFYGCNSDTIKKGLQEQNQILITNDKTSIEKLKKFFPQQVITIYVLSNTTTRNLFEIYLKRFGFPDLTCHRNEILKYFKLCSDMLEINDSKAFFESFQELCAFLETLTPDCKKYKTRVETLQNLSISYTKNIFCYDYVVLNFYATSGVEKRITDSAFTQLKEIIYRETKE